MLMASSKAMEEGSHFDEVEEVLSIEPVVLKLENFEEVVVSPRFEDVDLLVEGHKVTSCLASVNPPDFSNGRYVSKNTKSQKHLSSSDSNQSSSLSTPGTDGDALPLDLFKSSTYEKPCNMLRAHDSLDVASLESDSASLTPRKNDVAAVSASPKKQVKNVEQRSISDFCFPKSEVPENDYPHNSCQGMRENNANIGFEHEYAISEDQFGTLKEKEMTWMKKLRQYRPSDNQKMVKENKKRNEWRKSAKITLQMKQKRSNDYVPWEAKDAKLYFNLSSSYDADSIQPPILRFRSSTKENDRILENVKTGKKDKETQVNVESVPSIVDSRVKTDRILPENEVNFTKPSKHMSNEARSVPMKTSSDFAMKEKTADWAADISQVLYQPPTYSNDKNQLSENECIDILQIFPENAPGQGIFTTEDSYACRIEKSKVVIAKSLYAVKTLFMYEMNRVVKRQSEQLERIQQLSLELRKAKDTFNNEDKNRCVSTGNTKAYSLPNSKVSKVKIGKKNTKKKHTVVKRNFIGGISAEMSTNVAAKDSFVRKKKKEDIMLVHMYGENSQSQKTRNTLPEKKRSTQEANIEREKIILGIESTSGNQRLEVDLLGPLLRKLKKKFIINVLHDNLHLQKTRNLLITYRRDLLSGVYKRIAFTSLQLHHENHLWLREICMTKRINRAKYKLGNVFYPWRGFAQQTIILRGKMLNAMLHHEIMTKWKVFSVWRVSIFLKYFEMSTTACILQWRRGSTLGLHFFAWRNKARDILMAKSKIKACVDDKIEKPLNGTTFILDIYEQMRTRRKERYEQYRNLRLNSERCARLLLKSLYFGIRDENIYNYAKKTRELVTGGGTRGNIIPHGYAAIRKKKSLESWMQLGRSKSSAEIRCRFGLPLVYGKSMCSLCSKSISECPCNFVISPRLRARALGDSKSKSYTFKEVLNILNRHHVSRNIAYMNGCPLSSGNSLIVVPFGSRVKQVQIDLRKKISFSIQGRSPELDLESYAVIYANRNLCIRSFRQMYHEVKVKRAITHEKRSLQLSCFRRWKINLVNVNQLKERASAQGNIATSRKCIRLWQEYLVYWKRMAFVGPFSPWSRWKKWTKFQNKVKRLGHINILRRFTLSWRKKISEKNLLIRVFMRYEELARERDERINDPYSAQFKLLLKCINNWQLQVAERRRKRKQTEQILIADMFFSQTILKNHFKMWKEKSLDKTSRYSNSTFEFGLPVWTNPKSEKLTTKK